MTARWNNSYIHEIPRGTQTASWNRVDIAFNVVQQYSQRGALLPLLMIPAGSLLAAVLLGHLLGGSTSGAR